LKSTLKIKSFGPVEESKKGDQYRHITIEDLKNNKKADYLFYKQQKPGLWKDGKCRISSLLPRFYFKSQWFGYRCI